MKKFKELRSLEIIKILFARHGKEIEERAISPNSAGQLLAQQLTQSAMNQSSGPL
jgi:hypothetical protein